MTSQLSTADRPGLITCLVRTVAGQSGAAPEALNQAVRVAGQQPSAGTRVRRIALRLLVAAVAALIIGGLAATRADASTTPPGTPGGTPAQIYGRLPGPGEMIIYAKYDENGNFQKIGTSVNPPVRYEHKTTLIIIATIAGRPGTAPDGTPWTAEVDAQKRGEAIEQYMVLRWGGPENREQYFWVSHGFMPERYKRPGMLQRNSPEWNLLRSASAHWPLTSAGAANLQSQLATLVARVTPDAYQEKLTELVRNPKMSDAARRIAILRRALSDLGPQSPPSPGPAQPKTGPASPAPPRGTSKALQPRKSPPGRAKADPARSPRPDSSPKPGRQGKGTRGKGTPSSELKSVFPSEQGRLTELLGREDLLSKQLAQERIKADGGNRQRRLDLQRELNDVQNEIDDLLTRQPAGEVSIAGMCDSPPGDLPSLKSMLDQMCKELQASQRQQQDCTMKDPVEQRICKGLQQFQRQQQDCTMKDPVEQRICKGLQELQRQQQDCTMKDPVEQRICKAMRRRPAQLSPAVAIATGAAPQPADQASPQATPATATVPDASLQSSGGQGTATIIPAADNSNSATAAPLAASTQQDNSGQAAVNISPAVIATGNGSGTVTSTTGGNDSGKAHQISSDVTDLIASGNMNTSHPDVSSVAISNAATATQHSGNSGDTSPVAKAAADFSAGDGSGPAGVLAQLTAPPGAQSTPTTPIHVDTAALQAPVAPAAPPFHVDVSALQAPVAPAAPPFHVDVSAFQAPVVPAAPPVVVSTQITQGAQLTPGGISQVPAATTFAGTLVNP